MSLCVADLICRLWGVAAPLRLEYAFRLALDMQLRFAELNFIRNLNHQAGLPHHRTFLWVGQEGGVFCCAIAHGPGVPDLVWRDFAWGSVVLQFGPFRL